MPSKSYQSSESSVVWTDSGGDVLFDMGGLATNAVAMGAYHDLGVSPRADWYEFVVKIDGFSASPTLQGVIEFRISQSNATTGFDGRPTTDPTSSTAGTITFDQLLNCKMVGNLIVYSTTASDILQCRFVTRLTGRYIAPIIENRAGATTKSSGDTHTVTMTPIPQEAQ